MFSSKDFEKCWFLYQSEGLPYNISIEEFCLKQGVPVNEFNKWYRDTMERDEMIRYSQKNRHSSQKDERPTRDEERENHDGTPASAPSA